MFYEFRCVCDDKTCAARVDGKQAIFEIQYSIKNAPDLGTRVPCPADGCTGQVERIISTSVGAIVRGDSKLEMHNNQTYMAKVGGRDMPVQFIDHPHTAPEQMRNLAMGNPASPGLGKAYYNPKYGQVCVDVASDRPDPLGAMDRDRKNCDTDTKRVAVKSPFQTRKKAQADKKKVRLT